MSRLRQGFGAQGLLTSWLASPLPDAAVEIAPTRVSAAVAAPRGDRLAIQDYAIEPLPANALSPVLASHNIGDRPAVVAAMRAVLGRLRTRVARVALVVPDVVARVSVVRFEHVPARRDDLTQLVRWQVRKSAPFSIDDASVTFTPGRTGPDGSEFIVATARRDVVQEYESVCAEAGVHAGIVDLSTFSVLNLILAAPQPPTGDWLAVHMRPEYTSIAIARGENLIFFRNRPEGDEETLADVVHQTAMYYQDRLAGEGFARALLGGSGRTAGAFEDARRDLEARLGVPVESIDPIRGAVLPDRIAVTPEVIDALAPLSGMLQRAWREAAAA